MEKSSYTTKKSPETVAAKEQLIQWFPGIFCLYFTFTLMALDQLP